MTPVCPISDSEILSARILASLRVWGGLLLLGLGVMGFFLAIHGQDFRYMVEYRIQRTPTGILRYGLYVGTYFLQCVLLGKLLFSERQGVRWTALGLLFLLLVLNFSYVAIQGHGIGLAEVETIFREGINFGGEAIRTFQGSILQALLKAGLALGSLLLAARWVRVRFAPGKTALLSLSFPVMLGIFVATEATVIHFPVPMRVTGLFALHGMVGPDTGERDRVDLVPEGRPYRRHILFIVDESIRADHLSINGYPRNTTPFLASLGDRLLNFGVAASGANGSCPSNQILLGGLTPAEIPVDVDRLNRRPTIFDYAKATGLRTVCLDTQNASEEYILPNMASSIDRKYTIDGTVPRPMRDLAGLDWLEAELKRDVPTFFYMLKTGSHFRYEGSVPESDLRAQPFGPVAPSNQRDPLVNLYDTTVRWACDTYLERLYALCRDRDVLVIYTSDHGQNLLDDPRYISTHCVARDPNPEQANVPLLMMDFGPKRPDALLPMGPVPRDRASHFQIFPTLLKAMGYPASSVTPRFGPDLFEPPQEPRRFFSGGLTYKRLGGEGSPFRIGAPSYSNLFEIRPVYCPERAR